MSRDSIRFCRAGAQAEGGGWCGSGMVGEERWAVSAAHRPKGMEIIDAGAEIERPVATLSVD